MSAGSWKKACWREGVGGKLAACPRDVRNLDKFLQVFKTDMYPGNTLCSYAEIRKALKRAYKRFYGVEAPLGAHMLF